MTTETWTKQYDTLDDFLADTGAVVRERLDRKGQRAYDAARTDAARRIAKLQSGKRPLARETTVVIKHEGGKTSVVVTPAYRPAPAPKKERAS